MIKAQAWIVAGAYVLVCIALLMLPGQVVAAEPAAGAGGAEWTGLAYLAAALAVGLACIGSSYAVARIGSASLGAVTEKPELTGRALVFIGLAEGIAIYGLIIAIMILNKI